MIVRSRVARTPSLLLGVAVALAVAGCGGSSSSSKSTASTSASTTTPATTSTPSGATPLASPQAHAALVTALRGTAGVPPGQDDRLATCAIQRLERQGYRTLQSIPGAAGEAAGRACAQQLLGGLDGPIARQALLAKISKVPGVNSAQATSITNCVIARLQGAGYKSITAVPSAAAQKAGSDCARRVVRGGK